MRKLIGLFLLRVVLFLSLLAPSLSESFYFRLPCARGGGRRGTSLTEGLLHTRKSDPYTPSASHLVGTSLSEEGKGSDTRTREAGERTLFSPLAPSLREPASAASLRESPRRRKARNAGDVYRHPRAIYACVSFSQKIFCFAKSFLGALSYEPPLCKGRWLAVRRLAEAARRRDC